MFERLSCSSAGIADDDLAKDMGIFAFDKEKKEIKAIFSPKTGNRRSSYDELDIHNQLKKKTSSKS